MPAWWQGQLVPYRATGRGLRQYGLVAIVASVSKLQANIGGVQEEMSWKNSLRLGIIFTLAGLILLVHAVLTSNGHLLSSAYFIIGVVLVVVGVPLLAVAVRRRS